MKEIVIKNLKEYQELSQRTCPSLGSKELDILHMDMGIFTEIGEIVDIFKKKVAYKKEIDIVNLAEECADVYWYVSNKDRINGIIYDEQFSPLAHYDNEDVTEEDLIQLLLSYQSTYIPIIDVIYQVVSFYNIDLYKALENNIQKLLIRYPEKFSEERALNRDLKRERVQLEK